MKRALLILEVLVLTYGIGSAESNGPSGKFGIGVREPGKLTQWEYFFKYFVSRRVDIVAGFSYISNEEAGSDHTDLPLGIGAFYHFFPDRPVHLKLGARIGYERETSDGYYRMTSDSWAFEPTAGAEYFFSSHLSLGPEVTLQFGRTFEKLEDKNSGKVTKSDSSEQKFVTSLTFVLYF